MIDLSDMTIDQLKELRDNCNARIDSLTLQEKKKEDPRRYSYRTMDLLFPKEYYKPMFLISMEYEEYIKIGINGKLYTLGDNGSFYIIRLFAPKDIRDEIRSRSKYHRIYETYTPESKHMYPGYVIDGWNMYPKKED